jgi:hypothetical protein
MNKPDEVTISIWVLVIPALAILLGIGWFASPRDIDNRPLLLLPDVKAVEEYRRLANRWRDELRLVDGEIALILAGNTSDLFSQSRQAQNTLEHNLRIIQEIDRHDAPATLIGLQEELKLVAQSYLESSRLALRWLSLPDQANHDKAQDRLEESRNMLSDMEASQWLEKRSP